MARKDYYLILGVSRNENLRGIEEAFRELAKRYQPDRAAPQATRTFQDIQEAYAVLSDPQRRKSHNQALEKEELTTYSRPERMFSRSPFRPEPLVPRPMSVLHDFESIRPSFEPLFDRFVRNFTGKGVPKGERLEALNVEVTRAPDEMTRGVVVPVGIPVFHRCRQCGGSGRDWLFPCAYCNAQGIIEEEKTVRVEIPRMAPDRHVIEASIDQLGIHNFYLRLHIRTSR